MGVRDDTVKKNDRASGLQKKHVQVLRSNQFRVFKRRVWGLRDAPLRSTYLAQPGPLRGPQSSARAPRSHGRAHGHVHGHVNGLRVNVLYVNARRRRTRKREGAGGERRRRPSHLPAGNWRKMNRTRLI